MHCVVRSYFAVPPQKRSDSNSLFFYLFLSLPLSHSLFSLNISLSLLHFLLSFIYFSPSLCKVFHSPFDLSLCDFYVSIFHLLTLCLSVRMFPFSFPTFFLWFSLTLSSFIPIYLFHFLSLSSHFLLYFSLFFFYSISFFFSLFSLLLFHSLFLCLLLTLSLSLISLFFSLYFLSLSLPKPYMPAYFFCNVSVFGILFFVISHQSLAFYLVVLNFFLMQFMFTVD